MIMFRLSNYCEAEGILPKEPCGFRLAHTKREHAARRVPTARTRAS